MSDLLWCLLRPRIMWRIIADHWLYPIRRHVIGHPNDTRCHNWKCCTPRDDGKAPQGCRRPLLESLWP